MGRGPGASRHIPPVLLLVGLTVLLVALARPQTVVSLPKEEGTVILAFDASGSMAADDLKPTRIEAAQAAARDFVQRQPLSVQIGVVAFSDSGFAVQVPTNDKQAILASIDRLAPQRGTSLANGILASLNTIAAGKRQTHSSTATSHRRQRPRDARAQRTHTSAVIVLLTDGENNEAPDPLAAAQTRRTAACAFTTVGIGSAAGPSCTSTA